MPTHGSVAKSAREHKNAKPSLYCPNPKCLFLTGDGRPCPRHGGPPWTPEWAALARQISRGDISAEEAQRKEMGDAQQDTAQADH